MTADLRETHAILGNSIHDMKARSAQMEMVEIPMANSIRIRTSEVVYRNVDGIIAVFVHRY